MGGFGDTKALELQETQESEADPYADLREELEDVNANRPKTHIFMGLIGKENTGKSAVVFDFYQRYCDAFGKGRQTTLAEFDEEVKQ